MKDVFYNGRVPSQLEFFFGRENENFVSPSHSATRCCGDIETTTLCTSQ